MTPTSTPVIAPGSIVARIGGTQRFRVLGESRDGSVTAYGPVVWKREPGGERKAWVNSQRAKTRSFEPEVLRIVEAAGGPVGEP